MDPLPSLDQRFLRRATLLGRKGWGRVHPNPMVGCVIVRDGEVVGQGWHPEFGGPHAERVALTEAGGRARGATAYISLEPCAHHGKTPPCVEALIAAGVGRVVFAAADPGTASGGGARRLEDAGIEVVGPVLDSEQGRRENPAFFHAFEGAGPYVALKLAMSWDGRLSARAGTPLPVTGPEAQAEVHRLRAGFDGVVVGIGTALADDPRLTVRSGRVEPRHPPARVVLDSGLRLPLTAKLLEDAPQAALHLFAAMDAPGGAEANLRARGAQVHRVGRTPEGRLDLGQVLERCTELGLGSLFAEGGGQLASALLRENRVHRLYVFLAPRFLGIEGAEAFPGGLPGRRWRLVEDPERFGEDVLTTCEPEE